MPLFEAMIMNANITIAVSFPCVFTTKPTSFLCHKGTAKMVNSIKTKFIFDPAFGWQDFFFLFSHFGYDKHISLDKCPQFLS